MAEKKVSSAKTEIDINSVTICDATAQMLHKARRDGVETAFDRAASMKACLEPTFLFIIIMCLQKYWVIFRQIRYSIKAGTEIVIIAVI